MARSDITGMFLLSLCIVCAFVSTVSASICTSQRFKTTNKAFAHCSDLPVLNATLHWTYVPVNGSLDVAFRAPPAAPGGWVAWAINPTGQHMVGSQAIVGFYDRSKGRVRVFTTSIDSLSPSMKNETLSFPVRNLSGETTRSGHIIIFARVVLPRNTPGVDQVWQTGAAVVKGVPQMHPMTLPHFQSKGRLNLTAA